MAYRLVVILTLLAAVPASAQDQEVEAGAGLWLANPARVEDFVVKSTASVSAAWTNWYDERKGWTAGIVAVPHYDDRQTVYLGHVTWRRRWIRDDGTFNHLGFGLGPWIWHDRVPYGVQSHPSLALRLFWHVEALATRRIRDRLSLRAGVTITPLLHIPVVVQPTAMLVWSGRELSPVVNVWAMQEAAMTPEQEEPDERRTNSTRFLEQGPSSQLSQVWDRPVLRQFCSADHAASACPFQRWPTSRSYAATAARRRVVDCPSSVADKTGPRTRAWVRW